MYRHFLNAVYGFHYAVQAIFTLLTPIAFMALAAWFFTSKLGAPSWLWAVLLILGTFAGLIGMIKYLISMDDAEKRREKEQIDNAKQ